MTDEGGKSIPVYIPFKCKDQKAEQKLIPLCTVSNTSPVRNYKLMVWSSHVCMCEARVCKL